MTRLLLSIAALLALAVAPIWCGDPATPAAKAADFAATPPAPGAPPAPAVTAGLNQAGATTAAAAKTWYSDLGSGAVVAGVAALGVVEKFAPTILAKVLPAAGPFGGLIAMVLGLLQQLFQPAAARARQQLVTNHADAFQLVATVIQNTSNSATIQDLKNRLEEAMSPQMRSIVDAFVAQLEASGVDHDADVPEVAAK